MIIYKITNLINGKCYIGQTRRSLEVRWKRHKYDNKACVALKRAIDKHGYNSFKVEKIDEAQSIEELNKLEINYIKKYDCIAPKGYNLRIGGSSPKISEETRVKMSESRKGQDMSSRYRAIKDNKGNVFKSISEACKFYKKFPASIHFILRGKRNQTREGITFSYYKG
jgi:group I intron endonuclease